MLLSLPSLTPRRLMALARAHRTAFECLRAVRAGEAGSPRDVAIARGTAAAELARRVRATGSTFVTVDDPGYPRALLDLFDPPAGLFIRGRIPEQAERRVSIVGARNCSPGGREMAGSLGRALAKAGAVVVSGGARGIDAASHRGALAGGGTTVAVLGCGIDVRYPRQNRGLLEEIAARGTVVSEYPPGTPAEPFRFPARNRIVAALSEATVVVEGAEGSGSMITADHALEVGREVFAVPGTPASPLSAVPLLLIREGAGVIRGPLDLLHDLGLAAAEGDALLTGRGVAPPLDEAGAAVWQELRSPSPPDSLARSAGLSLVEVMRVLGSLEVRGMVRRVGGRYERTLAGAAVVPGPAPSEADPAGG